MKTPLLAAGAAAVMLLCSCGQNGGPGPAQNPSAPAKVVAGLEPIPQGAYGIGFVHAGPEDVLGAALIRSITDEAKARNMTFREVNAGPKQENQVKALRDFIALGVRIIILQPASDTGWDAVLQEAKQAKIPVIVAGKALRTADESLCATTILSDYVQQGRLAAEWLSKKLVYKAGVAELKGPADAAGTAGRSQGLGEVFNKYPEMKLLQSAATVGTKEQGKTVLAGLLASGDKNLRAVFAHTDEIALGAVLAVEEAGLKPGEDIVIVSVGGTRPALEAVVAGKLGCSVECNPVAGPALFEMLDAVRAGDPPERTLVLRDEVYDSGNAEKALPSRRY